MTEQRINKAIEILDYAIQNQISVSEACKQNGVASTYVKNIKMICKEEYNDGILEDSQFNRFMEKYDEYSESKGTTNQNDDLNVDIKKNTQKLVGENIQVTTNNKTMDVNWQGSGEAFDELNNEDDNSQIGYPENHIKTLDQLLSRCEVDKDIWEVDNYVVNKWDVTSFKEGGPQTWENFQVKARLKLKEVEAKAKTAGEIFQKMVHEYEPPVVELNFKMGNDEDGEENNILEISIFDLHYGKLAWNGETGENYDTKIARKRFIYAIKKLIQRANGFSIKRVLFPIGNDFFNSDNQHNTTSHGTPQDEDLRWQKTYESGCELMIDGINIVKQLGVPVDVVVVPGNHDFERMFFLGAHVAAWFRNDPQVNVDNRANPRKYYRWGKVLLGLTHGRHEAEKALPMLMATDKESKQYWSDTDFHEWHLGHFHRKKTRKYTALDRTGFTDEELGVTIRYLSSLTGTEEWHFLKGYVGQIKAGEAFIWNDNLGMIAHFNANYIFEGPVEEENDVETLLKK